MENKTSPTEAPVVVSNAFAQLLNELEDGETQKECSRKLTDLINAVSLNGKGGKINLAISVEPAARGAMGFTPEVTIKVPKAKPDATLMFVDSTDGGVRLSKDNPQQRKLEFKEVPKEEREIRDLNEVRKVVNG